MDLEMLDNLKQVRGYEIKKVNWNHPKDNFIEINEEANAITFKIQNGVKLKGEDGCEVSVLLEIVKELLDKSNDIFWSHHSETAIVHLNNALSALDLRYKEEITRTTK
jgi:hypothetical protein